MADNRAVLTGDRLVTSEAIDRMEVLDKKLLKILDSYKQLISAAQSFTTSGRANKIISERNQLDGEFVSLQKEKQRLLKAVERQEAKNTLATSKASKALASERFETQKLNRENKQAAILTSRFADAYDKLGVKLAVAKRNLKNLTIEEGQFSNATKKARLEVDKLNAKMKQADNIAGDYQRSVGNYPTSFKPAIGAIKSLIGAFGLTEGLRLGFNFAKESLELSRQAKGVEFAFERLGNVGEDAFRRVKKSTRGLLSDLNIKSSLVDFDNFNISLAESDTLFEFLAVRAAQTGKSVDKLKDSLVEGLSKESKLRIDNLGISAAELNDELSKTPNFVQAVANIAKREVAEAGDILDKAANSQERFNSSVENTKIAFGQLLQSSGFNVFGFIADQVDKVTFGLKLLKSSFGTVQRGVEDFLNPIKDLSNQFPIVGLAISKANKAFEVFKNVISTPGITVFADLLRDLGATLSGLGSAFSASKDAAIDFIKTLASFGDINFSLNPVANFQEVKKFLSQSKSSFLSGGSNVAESFKKGFNDALTFSESKEKVKKEIKDIVENTSGVSTALKNTIDFYEELIAKTEKARDATAKTKEEYESFGKTIDELKDKLREIQLGGGQVKIDVPETRGLADIGTGSISAEDLGNSLQYYQDQKNFEDSEKEKTRIAEKHAELRRGVFSQTVDYLQQSYGIDLSGYLDVVNQKVDADETAEERRKRRSENAIAIAQSTGNTLLTINDSILQGTLDRLSEQENANRAMLERVLNDESSTEQERKAAQTKYDAENLKIRQKRFKAEQKASIAQTLINMAVAIVQAYAQLGPIGGTIAGVIISGIAAYQVQQIKKQKPPEFFKGKNKHNKFEGWGTWGEKRREVKIGADGSTEVSPNRTTPLYVKKDDIIIPSLAQYDREIQDPTSDVFKRVNRKLADDTNLRMQMVVVHNEFDTSPLKNVIANEIRNGFKGVKIQAPAQSRPNDRRTRFAI